MTLKFTMQGLLTLNPFEEDTHVPRTLHRAAIVLSVLHGAGFVTVVAGALAWLCFPGEFRWNASPLLITGAALSLVAAGLEWHLGLQAKSANLLFKWCLVAMALSDIPLV